MERFNQTNTTWFETSLITKGNLPGAYFADGSYLPYSLMEAAVPSTEAKELIPVASLSESAGLEYQLSHQSQDLPLGFCEKPVESMFCIRQNYEPPQKLEVESVTDCIWHCQAERMSLVRITIYPMGLCC